jgi:hypothetical protein
VSILKRARAGIIAAIVTFTVLAGTGVGYAYWSATAQATLGTGAATLTSTTTGWTATTLGNEDIPAVGSVSLVSTGSITFTNTTNTTSSQAQNLSVLFSAPGGSDATLTGNTTLTAWWVASAASCTPSASPVSPVSGTWAAGVTVTRTLAPGASATYCLRNTVSDRQLVDDTDGARSFTPQAVATLSIGNFTASATTTSAISTAYVFPLQTISSGSWNYVRRAGPDFCWDVSGSGNTDGSLLISYACKNNTDLNQDFRYLDSNGDGYGEFVPRHATNLRVAAAASTVSGSAVDMRTASGAPQQSWQPQLVAAGTYQLVNKYSGLCLSAPGTSAGVMTQVTCNGGADQKFTLTFRSAVQLASLTCLNTGTDEDRGAQLTWTADYNGAPYTVQVRKGTSGGWTTLDTTSGSTYTVPGPSGSAYSGTYQVQILNADGQVVGTRSLTSSAQYEFIFFFQYNYTRC